MSTIANLFANLALAQVLPSLIIVVIGIFGIQFAMKLAEKALEKSKLEKAAHKLILSAVQILLYALLALIVASKLGLDVTGIIALASVATLAISLALQNALANVFGGFVLLSTHPFHSGDFVEVAGQSGTVQEIGLTYTKLVTADSKLVSIPNSAVTSAQIVNYTAIGIRRVDIAVSASYNAPLDTVLAALKQAAQVPTALEEKAPFAAVKNYGDSAIEYILQVWSTADDYWTTLFTVNANIKAKFDEAGIEMTYPHLNVHLDK
jgi:small conductance mechanosensitive channel